MPACRKGDSLSNRSYLCKFTTTLTTPAQSTVFNANSLLMARITDKTVPHPFSTKPSLC